MSAEKDFVRSSSHEQDGCLDALPRLGDSGERDGRPSSNVKKWQHPERKTNKARFILCSPGEDDRDMVHVSLLLFPWPLSAPRSVADLHKPLS